MSTLAISLGGCRLGAIHALSEAAFQFRFAPRLAVTDATPILGLHLEDVRPRTLEATGHLPLWFEHLLPPPASRLRRLLRVESGIADDALDESFRLLAFLGDDLPGAVFARPDPSAAEWSPPRAAPLQTPKAGQLRSALAGQQPKLSVRAGERGLVAPALGESSAFIAKFASPQHPELPRIEHATMSWARAVGVDVPSFRLANLAEFDDLPEGTAPEGSVAFLIERFDRVGSERMHMEDFAQILDRPLENIHDGKIEHIAAVLASYCPEDVEQLCRRVAFCIASGNGDAHLKNWSLLYRQPREPRLSPAYDLVSTILVMRDETLGASINGKLRFDALRLSDFDGLARVTQRDAAEVRGWVVSTLAHAREALERDGEAFGFSAHQQAALRRHLAQLRLVTG